MKNGNEIQNLFKRFSNTFTKNSPTILTGISVAGLVTTTVLAVKATPKALQLIEEELKEREEENLSKKELVMVTWKCYIPALAMGSLTIACIVSAHSIHLRRNAALASIFSISETALKEYQTKVVETIGSNKEQKIRDEVIKDKLHKNPVNEKEMVITGNGDTLCYDALSGRYFKSDIESIKRAMNKLSRDLMSEMFMTMNQVYYELGLKGTKIGDLIGWHVADGLIEPYFSSQLTENGTPCLVLDFNVEPRYYESLND